MWHSCGRRVIIENWGYFVFVVGLGGQHDDGDEGGFTLIELLVVIAIIALLIAILLVVIAIIALLIGILLVARSEYHDIAVKPHWQAKNDGSAV